MLKPKIYTYRAGHNHLCMYVFCLFLWWWVIYQYFCPLDKFWIKKSGPVFFYSGNEGPIDGFWRASGFVHELAAKYNALIVFAEHVSMIHLNMHYFGWKRLIYNKFQSASLKSTLLFHHFQSKLCAVINTGFQFGSNFTKR